MSSDLADLRWPASDGDGGMDNIILDEIDTINRDGMAWHRKIKAFCAAHSSSAKRSLSNGASAGHIGIGAEYNRIYRFETQLISSCQMIE